MQHRAFEGHDHRRSEFPFSGVPLSIQRLSRSTFSLDHGVSQAIDPALSAARMLAALAVTSSNDQRSKTPSIAARSGSRNSGLMSFSKLGAAADMVFSFCVGRRLSAVVAVRLGRIECWWR